MTHTELRGIVSGAMETLQASGLEAVCYIWSEEDDDVAVVASTQDLRTVEEDRVALAIHRLLEQTNVAWNDVLEAVRRTLSEQRRSR